MGKFRENPPKRQKEILICKLFLLGEYFFLFFLLKKISFHLSFFFGVLAFWRFGVFLASFLLLC
jgi:hypothetical protein